MRSLTAYLFVGVAFCIAGYVKGDTPANCSYEQILGTWKFIIGETKFNNTVQCKSFDPVSQEIIQLYFPDIAIDLDGNQGFWTLIYNQGFEVVIKGRKFFAFSKYMKNGNKIVSICNETLNGWSHDVDQHNWGCYQGTQVQKTHPFVDPISMTTKASPNYSTQQYRGNQEYVDAINRIQNSWKATVYPEYEGMTLDDLMNRAGGRRSANAFPKPAPPSEEATKAANELPLHFDWRDVKGVNFVSPIRNQLSCGSCYAFGSMAMHEARLRVYSNNSVQTIFSTQDIVSCSEYAQGCEGGFPYLIAGKYAQDFGVIEDSCFPYTAEDSPCKKSTCKRHLTSDYYYIGGFYGACNEPLMRLDLVKNGPVAISFQVYPDFPGYKGGIYHHTGLVDKFNPWEITNHVVLIVGYGADKTTGEKYWIVKNSWGAKWGLKGYFMIRRDTDECSMESMSVGSTPIVD